MTHYRALSPIDLRWGDKDGKDGAFQGENGSYQEMLVPGGGVEPPWAEARGILSPVLRGGGWVGIEYDWCLFRYLAGVSAAASYHVRPMVLNRTVTKPLQSPPTPFHQAAISVPLGELLA